jgi:hypothetical protein
VTCHVDAADYGNRCIGCSIFDFTHYSRNPVLRFGGQVAGWKDEQSAAVDGGYHLVKQVKPVWIAGRLSKAIG